MNEVQMPASVEKLIREYIRQRNLLLLLRGLLSMVVVLLGWMMLWCLGDRLGQFDASVRLVIWAGSIAWFGVWTTILLHKTVFSQMQVNDAAMEVELLRPDLDERLSTLCSRLRDHREGLASEQMLAAIAAQVDDYISQHGMPRLVSLRTLGRHAGGLAAVALTIGAIAWVPLLGLPQLAVRLLVPWGRTPPVTTTRLTPLYSDESLNLRENEAMVLNVLALRPGEDGVMLHFSTDGKTWDSVPMGQTGGSRYQAVLGPAAADQQFYLESGDAKTPISTLRVMRRPAVTEFRIRYEYPAYLNREPFIARNVDGLIEAPVGTKASVKVVGSEKLRSARLEGPGFALDMTPTIEPAVMEATLNVVKDQPYRAMLVSAKGLEGQGPETSRIRAIADRPPFVQLVSPGEDVRLGPREITSVRFSAMDDYGLSRLAMRLQVNSAQPIEMPIRREGDPRRREGSEELDLANLGLQVGDVVALSLVAKDSAGQESASETRYIFVSPHSVSATDYTRMSELVRAAEASKELAKVLEETTASLDRARGERDRPEAYAQSLARYQQGMADVGQEAQVLASALSRAVSRSSNARLNNLLATVADRALVRMVESHDLADELGKGDAREQNARQRLDRATQQMRQVRDELTRLVGAERAAAALADYRNLKAAGEARKTGKIVAHAAEMFERMKQDVADQVKQQGFNPDDPNIEGQLQSRANGTEDLLAAAKPMDFAAAAQSWADQLMDEKVHAPMFDRRLAAAAEVESVRGDGKLQRAGDLNLSGRAAQGLWLMSQDPQGRAVADQARKDYVQAFGELERAAARSETEKPTPEDARRVADARAKMARWAGEGESTAGPAQSDDPRDIAFEANAEMVNRNYDRASELQKRMAMEEQQAAEAADALRDAEAADQLAQTQDALRQQLQASQAEAAAMAQRQKEIARQIDEQMGEQADMPVDTRRDAMAAIQAVQERLAQMPQQLQDATHAADVQIQAHDLAERLSRDAQGAPADRKEAADRAAGRAATAEGDARKQTEQALAPVDGDVANVMKANLSDFLPETTGATAAIETKLTPALQAVRTAAMGNRSQELVRGVSQARDAIADVQAELRRAQEALLDRDPLFAAKVYAEAAARALSRVPPDVALAMQNQQRVSESLGKQWNADVRTAAKAHFSSVPGMRDVYAAGTPARSQGSPALSLSREWGVLPVRQQGELTAAAKDSDPSGYERMLQAYFRALGKVQEQAK